MESEPPIHYASQKQTAANRRNAAKSTGPRTPEGRAAVRHNALRHGLRAETLVLNNEEQEQFVKLQHTLQSEHQPAGPTEQLVLNHLVVAAWRLQRRHGIETGIYNLALVDIEHEDYD